MQSIWVYKVDKNKENENVQDMVPSFAETYEALEKVTAFFMWTV
jgi:hypothetical protein